MRKKLNIIKWIGIMVLAKIVSLFIRKTIVIVGEKVDEARDNGYWFFKYLCQKYPGGNYYFVIKKTSADIFKIREITDAQHIIEPGSFKHCVYYWAAKYNISSQPFGVCPCDYFTIIVRLLFLKSPSQKVVFLQHGIIKDHLSGFLDKSRANIDYFVTSSPLEQEAVMDYHGYNDSECILTGMCRFDNLPVNSMKNSHQILVMPTFRHWLMCSNDSGIPTDVENNFFKKDDFYKEYYSLLSSKTLYSLLKKYDYKLIFYPHYCTQPFLHLFENVANDRIILASSKNFDVQNLLIESDMLVTDFSSVFFDFAYMKKPEIFFQFDEDKYRGGHYKEGYFSYEKHAFGPVVRSLDDLLSNIEKILANDCRIDDEYKNRVEIFFAFTDQKNCERTYNQILKNYEK